MIKKQITGDGRSPSVPRLALAGVGGYGRIHLEGFYRLQQEGLVAIVAVADRSAEALRGLDDFSDLAGTLRFTDYERMLEEVPLDALVIAAPIPYHYEMARAALEKQIFILLEKPPTILLSELERLAELDRERRVMVGFQHVYSNVYVLAEEIVRSGQLGEVKAISTRGIWPRPTGYYERAGWAGKLSWNGTPVFDGPATNAFAHFLHLLLQLGGGQVERLRAELYRARPIESYDTCCIAGELTSGTRFYAGFSHAAEGRQAVRFDVIAEKGRLRVDNDWGVLTCGSRVVPLAAPADECLRRAFLAFASGDAASNKTPLSSTEGFVRATNLMLLSSAGVHTIDPAAVRVCNPGVAAEALYCIKDFAAILERSAQALVPFSELGDVAWSVPGKAVSGDDLVEDQLLSLYGIGLAESRDNALHG